MTKFQKGWLNINEFYIFYFSTTGRQKLDLDRLVEISAITLNWHLLTEPSFCYITENNIAFNTWLGNFSYRFKKKFKVHLCCCCDFSKHNLYILHILFQLVAVKFSGGISDLKKTRFSFVGHRVIKNFSKNIWYWDISLIYGNSVLVELADFYHVLIF